MFDAALQDPASSKIEYPPVKHDLILILPKSTGSVKCILEVALGLGPAGVLGFRKQDLENTRRRRSDGPRSRQIAHTSYARRVPVADGVCPHIGRDPTESSRLGPGWSKDVIQRGGRVPGKHASSGLWASRASDLSHGYSVFALTDSFAGAPVMGLGRA